MNEPVTKEKKFCTKSVSDHTGFHWHKCGKPAKYKHAGKETYRCGIHVRRDIARGVEVQNMSAEQVSAEEVVMSIDAPDFLRAIKGDPSFESAELFRSASSGHKFAAGQTCILVGLQDFTEYNGEEVKITAIREDGHNGKAYYISGRINEVMNWIYEYRLSPLVQA